MIYVVSDSREVAVKPATPITLTDKYSSLHSPFLGERAALRWVEELKVTLSRDDVEVIEKVKKK